ncbi:polysaccharide deacetylase family protein [Paenibacillus cremeus]|uniref:Polysaccharide deacetylase family protein n=1 Tax=Paenibacillus cremeus TaxID=2163881 RepID=A0A559JPU8_9BACL|nr:polysaccharide deacetylase family protein [Paenibacillus cremeus]TVY01902.1 polysaccharide deacetylase family protein [Paenibacillus cremeus]
MASKLLTALLIAVMLLSTWDVFAQKDDWRYRNQVAVLMYHHVHDTDESSSTVSSALFREQLSDLKARGYHFISMQQFKAFYEGAPVPDNAVFVTFDDGYESFYLNAFPILKELDVPAVNFIVTKDLADPKATSIPSLSREEIREMLSYKPGMIDVGCHSDNLHFKAEDDKAALTNPMTGASGGSPESASAYNDRILADTKACVQKLDELYAGMPVKSAGDTYAYPFGIFTAASEKLVTEGGTRYAFTIVSEMATRGSSPLEIPRINAGNPSIKPEQLHKQIMLRVKRAGAAK